jgi:hypothetical protein
VGADHRVFLDATLPYLDVVWQVARQAAGEHAAVKAVVHTRYGRRRWSGSEAVHQFHRWAWGMRAIAAIFVVAFWDMVAKPGL